jgi:hypothetical protein
MIVIGLGMILFGGTYSSGTYIELFGFRFGRGETEKMGTGQSWFWGVALIVGGAVLVKFSIG